MQRYLERELNKLYEKFNNLCELVQSNYAMLYTALENMDEEEIKRVIDNDKLIDEQEITIEEECLKILALYQPVAGDLRMIVSILKINNDLERIGDLTSNIAERAQKLLQINMPILQFLIPEIYEKVKYMLKHGIKSVTNRDSELAIKVCQLDDEVDNLHSKMYRLLDKSNNSNPDNFTANMNYISISRFLERIADHATNIAEDLLYLMDGEILRHRNRFSEK